MSYTAAHTLDEALAAHGRGRTPRRGRLRPRGRRAPGQVPAARAPRRASTASRARLASPSRAATLVLGALVNHAEIEANAEVAAGWTGLADGSALVGSPATRHVGTIGGNIMNSSPAMDTGAALLVLGAEVELRSQGGSRTVSLVRALDRPGSHLRQRRRAAREVRVPGAAGALGQRLPAARVPARDGDRRRRRRGLRHAQRRRGRRGLPHRADGRRAHHRALPERRGRDRRQAASTRRRSRPSPPARAPTPRRSATSAPASATAATPSASWPAGPSRPRSPARAASTSPSPPTAPRASARPSEAEPMSVSITLNVNGVPYPVTVEPHRTLVSVIRGEIGLTGTKEGCDDCECGACMVLVDGRPVNSCSYLAVQTDGREVTTVEGSRQRPPSRTRCSATSSPRAASSAASARPAC